MMPFYIYRHIRPDTNEVFYIGKGNNLSDNDYGRMDWKHKRNNIWNKIVKKNSGSFISEIMFECETENEINKKEVEFIALYGRINIGNGTLANLTDGGEGCVGMKHSEETLRKLSHAAKNRASPNPFKGKKHTDETKRLFSQFRTDNPTKKKMKFINVATKEISYGTKGAALSIGLNKASLSKAIKDNYKRNTTPIVKYDDYVSGNYKANVKRKKVAKNCKRVIDINTNEIFPSIQDASIRYGLDVSTLRKRLCGLFNNNTSLIYYNGESM